MSEIKAIETEYNGYRFRSRLEARWAVFFDVCGIEYEYEKEGFELSDGTRYLPDFYLPKFNYYAEVKAPSDHTVDDLKKIGQAVSDGHLDNVILLTEIPNATSKNTIFWYCALHRDFRYLSDFDTDKVCFMQYEDSDEVIIQDDFGEGRQRPSSYFPGLFSGFINEKECIARTIKPVPSQKANKGCVMPVEEGFGECSWRVRKAFQKARKARFEHGETPSPIDTKRDWK